VDYQHPVTTIGNCLIWGKGSYLADGLCMPCWDRKVDLDNSGKIRDWRVKHG